MNRLLLTREVAAILSVTPSYVWDHKTELGGIRLGAKHSALRFPEQAVTAFLDRKRLERDAPAAPRRKPGPSRAVGFQLLPVPGEA